MDIAKIGLWDSPFMERLLNLINEKRYPNNIDKNFNKHNSVRGLIHLLEHLPKLGTVVEIGSFRGISTEAFLIFADKVIAVDHWKDIDEVYREFLERVGNYNNLEIIKKHSEDAVLSIDNETCDLVYIDASHDYENVVKDIKNWLPKVKKGKWMGGHDYTDMVYGDVIKSVNEVFGKPDHIFEDSSWIVQVWS